MEIGLSTRDPRLNNSYVLGQNCLFSYEENYNFKYPLSNKKI